MDESLMVRVRIPRDHASHTSDANTSEGSAVIVVESPGLTSHDDDVSDGHEELPGNAKKRKSTYTARKAGGASVEEMSELSGEVVKLREQLREMQAQQLRFQPLSMEEKTHTASLRWQVTQSRLAIANAQSMVSSYSTQYGKPLIGNYIHLPRDPVQRQQILESLKPQKMQEALAFLAARCQFMDLRRHTRQLECYETATGDRITTHWEVTKIKEGQPTVRRVYEEMLEFTRTSEMALAEKAGVVAVRESDMWLESVDATQFRLLASHPPNFLVEKNYAVYTQYFPRSEALDQPHGVLLCDYVDQDDAHPYQPDQRIRTDVSSVTMLVECPVTDPDEPRAVIVINWAFKRIHNSPLATEEDLWAIDREGPRSYYDVMMRTIRERLACQM